MSNGQKKQPTQTTESTKTEIKRIPSNTKLRWVNPYLGSDDKRWLQDHHDNSLELILEMVEYAGHHSTISCKFEDKSSRFLASMVCTDSEHPGAGCAISVRGATASHALFALAYLVAKSPDSQWWLDAASADGDPWG